MNWYNLDNIKKLQKAWEMILPTIYNESLSYIQKLEHILDIIKKLIDSNIELMNEWVKLKDFINEQLEYYAKGQLQEWLDDGTLTNIVIEALKPLVETKKDKEQENDNTQNIPLLTNEIIECALSYYYHNSELYYDNETALNDSMQINGQGRKAIDCSTFICLCLNGVKYETSRYALGGDKYNNHRDYIWGVNIYDNGTNNFRRYANMMGEYFYNCGWSFKPNKDFSNLRTGDLMFWKGQPVEDSFRDISHVAIFLTKTVDDKLFYLDANKNRVNVIDFSSMVIDETALETIILCARFNFNGVNYVLPQNIVNGNTKELVNNTTGISYSTLSPLQKGYYTVLIKGSGDAPSVKSNGFSNAALYIGNNLYIAYLRLNDIINNDIAIYVSNNQKTFNLEWVCVYRRYLSYPVPYYVAPTLKGNRGKITLKQNYNLPQNPSSYAQIPFDNFLGNNFSHVFKRNGNFIQVLESGAYLVNVSVYNRTNTYGNIRVSKFDESGGSQSTLAEDNIQYIGSHSAYKKMSFGVSLSKNEQIGLLMTCDEQMTIGSGSFGTYIELIKL